MRKENMVKELESLKLKYKKHVKVITFILFTILIVIIIRSIYLYSIISNIYKVNVSADLGENYKITYYTGEDEKESYSIYYKNNIRRMGDIYFTQEGTYMINESTKQYDFQKDFINNEKNINLFSRGIDFNINDIIFGKVSIKKEKYRGRDYITVQLGAHKIWVDRQTLLIKKEKYEDEIIANKIEQGVVKDDDVMLPNLSDYTMTN